MASLGEDPRDELAVKEASQHERSLQKELSSGTEEKMELNPSQGLVLATIELNPQPRLSFFIYLKQQGLSVLPN